MKKPEINITDNRKEWLKKEKVFPIDVKRLSIRNTKPDLEIKREALAENR